METDALLGPNDIEEALSDAYVYAVASMAGFTVSKANFDRDGVDVTFGAGGAMRPKIDAQLKATINLTGPRDGAFAFACPRHNYDLLREPTQTPRILIVLHLPKIRADWLAISPKRLILKRCAYWTSLRGAPETENTTSVTVALSEANLFDVESLKTLMALSRTGSLA